MRIYVASSWRNKLQPTIVHILRQEHQVYDFRNPSSGGFDDIFDGALDGGFHWSDIDPEWKDWTPERYRDALFSHPLAEVGATCDQRGLDWAEACVLVLPCGRSAHLELGYMRGQRKRTSIVMFEQCEPELMYRLCDEILTSADELMDAYGVARPPPAT